MPRLIHSRLLAALLVLSAAIPVVIGAQETPTSALPAAEQARYYALLEELRCLVCQNQTLAESNAELAGDLRGRVLTMVKDGASDEEILSFMTERYGDFIRYRPPLKPKTYLLWAAPLILLIVLLTALFRHVAASSQRGPE